MAPITVVDNCTVIESGEAAFNSQKAEYSHLFRAA
jgi:hypothetical protein